MVSSYLGVFVMLHCCVHVCIEAYTFAGGLPVSYQFATAPVTKQGESPLAVTVCERNLDVIKYLVKECNANIDGVSLI